MCLFRQHVNSKQRAGSAGVNKEKILLAVKVAVLNQLEEARQRLSGVDRIDQNALLARQLADGSRALRTCNGITGADVEFDVNVLTLHRNIALKQFLQPAHQVIRNVSKRIVADAHADRARSRQEQLCAVGQAGIGSAGTGGADNAVKLDAQSPRLLCNFLCAVDITERAQRHRSAHGDENRAYARPCAARP